jgi:hypothetical protein
VNDTERIHGTTSRRELLRRGRKLAYVAPVVVVSMQAVSACNISGAPEHDYNYDEMKQKFYRGEYSRKEIDDFKKKHGFDD